MDTTDSTQTMEKCRRKRQAKYKKTSEEDRKRLLYKIFHDHKTIKQVAKEMNINYSTAKTILFFYRKKQRTKEPAVKDPAAVCGVQSLTDYKGKPLEYSLVVCEGGDEIAFKTHAINLQPPEIKQEKLPILPPQWKLPPFMGSMLPPQTNPYFNDSFNQIDQMTKRLLQSPGMFGFDRTAMIPQKNSHVYHPYLYGMKAFP